VFKSTDRGNSWEVISDDLTAQKDRDELKIMDKYWSIDAVRKHVSTSLWGTIVSLDESRVKKGLIYAGSDDGVISVTEDDGKNWRRITAKELGVPEYTYISDIQADKFDENVVYVTFDNRKMDDFKPYVFKSKDKGKTWTAISSTLPDNYTVHSIQQDHKDAKILFIGTEFGVFTSIDGGKKWIQLKSGLPTIAVRDLAIQERENDLVLATFGRGFYILDDYTPLRQLSESMLEKQKGHIFEIKDADMYVQTSSRSNQGSTYYVAENPKYGAHIRYYVKDVPKSSKAERQEKEKELFEEGKFIPQPSWRDVELEALEEGAHLIFTIKDAEGNAIRTLTQKASQGMGEIVWDLRHPSPRPIITDKFNPAADSKPGWPAMPGKYTITMEMWHNDSLSELAGPVSFEVKKLFEDEITNEERKQITAFDQKVSNMVRVSNAVSKSIKESNKKVASMLQTMYNMDQIPENEVAKARALLKELEELRFKMEGVKPKASWEEIPPSQMPISKRVSEVAYTRYASTGKVTQTEMTGYEIVKEEMQPVIDQLSKIIKDEIPAIESQLESMGASWTPGRIPKW
jgi:photosystem II stability/assembly factor-like uncharacterized protein